jgi:TonB-dependent receptor
MKRSTIRRPLWAGLLFLFVMFFGLGTARAQAQTGSISGTLIDATGSVLTGAQIVLTSNNLLVKSDQQGRFFISGLAPGNYTLNISYVGFKSLTKIVTVSAGATTEFTATLDVTSKEQNVLVTASSASAEVEAVNEERSADNIIQVMPVQTITSLPSPNLGNAIGRLPSVSLTRNEGQDQYVQVRGTEPRLNNTTVDGFNLPAEDPGVREVDYSVIPAGIVDSIQISKTLMANMDGDGIGGSVNLVTKTATDTPDYQISILGGFTPIENGRPNSDNYGTWGRRFGASKKLGFIVGGEYSWDGTGINDVEPSPDIATLSNGKSETWFDAQDVRVYQFHRPRWGLAGSLDYRLKPGSTIFLRYLYSNYRDSGDKTDYTLTDNTPGIQLLSPSSSGCSGSASNGATALPCNTAPSFYIEGDNRVFYSGSVEISGTHVLSKTWYNWSAAVGTAYYGGANAFGANNVEAYFTDNLATSSCHFNPGATTDPHLPQWSSDCFDEINSPQNYTLGQIQYRPGHNQQINIGIQGSGAFRYHLGGRISTLEYGTKFRSLHQYSDIYYDEFGTNGNVPMTAFPNGLKASYYNGSYKDGYNVFYAPVADYIKKNPTQFTLTSTTRGVDGDEFGIVEHIPAVYVMNTTDFGRGVRLVVGLRAEITTDNVHNLSFDPQGNASPNKFSGSYYDLLPSVSLRFNAGANSFLRLIYARGVSRPEEQDIGEKITWSTTGGGSFKDQASLGNANLKAETGDDIDVLYDHYFKTFGVFSAGYFYKHLGLPIVTTEAITPNFQPPGGPVGTYLVTQPVNGGSAWVSGVELQYLQHWSNLPGFLGGLGMSANYSYIGSRASGIPNRSDNPRLLDDAPNIFNIGPTYNRGRLSLNMDVTSNQANISAYQYTDTTPGGKAGPLGDTYFYTHTEVDAQGNFAFRPGFQLLVTALNLTNEVFGFYNGSAPYMIQREYYQPTYSFGFRWTPVRKEK